MREKIASYNKVSDKGMDLISKISYMNDLVRSLILSPSKDTLEKIAEQAKMMEVSVASYQDCLISAVEDISKEEDSEEYNISAIEDEDGFRLN